MKYMIDWEWQKVVPVDNLEPYFKIGEEIAKTSPCLRRQYGAVVVHGGPVIHFEAATNTRMGKCCAGYSCARTELQISHGQRVEVGGEIHAETAALIKSGIRPASNVHFVLVGFTTGGKQLFGRDVWPCHSCAMALKFAGYKHIYIKDLNGDIYPESVAYIIEERELEWERADNDA
jgi:dCMP deaminase